MDVDEYIGLTQLELETINEYTARFLGLRERARVAPEPHIESDFAAATRYTGGVAEVFRPIATGLLDCMRMDDAEDGPYLHLEAFWVEVQRVIRNADTTRGLAYQAAALARGDMDISDILREEAVLAQLSADAARAIAVTQEEYSLFSTQRADLYQRAAISQRDNVVALWVAGGLAGDGPLSPNEAALPGVEPAIDELVEGGPPVDGDSSAESGVDD